MQVQFQILMGKEARSIDPEKVQWPDDTIVVFARDGEKIIGRSAIMQMPHIEGTWVEESKRGTPLAARLVSKIESIMQHAKKPNAFAFIQDSQPEVAGYMQRIGYTKMPVSVYCKEFEKCQP